MQSVRAYKELQFDTIDVQTKEKESPLGNHQHTYHCTVLTSCLTKSLFDYLHDDLTWEKVCK